MSRLPLPKVVLLAVGLTVLAVPHRALGQVGLSYNLSCDTGTTANAPLYAYTIGTQFKIRCAIIDQATGAGITGLASTDLVINAVRNVTTNAALTAGTNYTIGTFTAMGAGVYDWTITISSGVAAGNIIRFDLRESGGVEVDTQRVTATVYAKTGTAGVAGNAHWIEVQPSTAGDITDAGGTYLFDVRFIDATGAAYNPGGMTWSVNRWRDSVGATMTTGAVSATWNAGGWYDCSVAYPALTTGNGQYITIQAVLGNYTFLMPMGLTAVAAQTNTPLAVPTFTSPGLFASNLTTAGIVTASPSGCAAIAVSAPYTNDANGNNTLSYRTRTPSGTGIWSAATPLAHSASPYAFSLTGLTHGATYDVEVTYVDANGVTGTALQTVSNVTVGGACSAAGAATATQTPGATPSIAVSAPYTQDTNANNTLSYRYRPVAGAWVGPTALAHAASPYAFALSGLTCGSSYDVEVTYLDADGIGSGTAVQTVLAVALTNCTLAGTPTAVVNSCTQVTVSAPHTQNADGDGTTSFERGPTATGAWTSACAGVTGASPRTCVDTGVLASSTNYYRVTYADPDAVGGTAQQVIGPFASGACTPVVPGTPTATVDSCTQVTVTSPYAGDANANSTTTVEYNTTNTWPGTTSCASGVGVSPRTCAVAALANNTGYYFRVTFTDADGVTGTNPQVIGPFTTQDCRVAPGVATAAPTAGSCTGMTVGAPFTENGAINSTTKVEWNTTNTWPGTTSCALIAGASPRTCAVAGLIQSTAYYFRVTFTDADGVSGTNPQVIGPTSTTSCRVTTGTPTATADSCSQVTVSNPYSDDANANSTTAVEYNTTSTWPGTTKCAGLAGASPRACAVNGLVPLAAYYFRTTFTDADGVTGTNPQVTGPVSTPACAAQLTVTSPGQPVAATIAVGSAANLVGRLSVATNTGTLNLLTLGVQNGGGATALPGVDVQALQLWEDRNANGTLEPATDTLLATGPWDTGSSSYAFTGLSFPVTTTAKTLLVSLNVASGATVGRTFVMSASSGLTTVGAPNTVGAYSITGSTFTIGAGPGQGGPASAPSVVIVNPSSGATASGTFRVQVVVHTPGAAVTAVTLSTDNGATYPTTLTVNANYGASVLGLNAAMYEVSGGLALVPGSYSLKARATNGSVATSTGVLVVVRAAGTGDGNLLLRDNSSQLCTDCHAIATHSSQSTSYNYGAWAIDCRTCHTPHSTKNIFLLREKIATPNSGSKALTFYNTTGLAPNSFVTSTGPAVAGTGVCEVCHTRTSNSAVAGAATATFTAGGTTVSCVGTCSWTAALVGALVKQTADAASAWTLVTAATATTLTLEASGYRGTAGIGVAYATRSARYRNTGDNAQHFTGVCTDCHVHSDGFAPKGCLDCHGTVGAETQDLGASFWTNGTKATFDTGEWTWSGHGKSSGTYDVTGNVAASLPTAPSPGTSECLYCHDDSVGHQDGTNPFRLRGASDLTGATAAYSTAAPNAPCLNCHNTGSNGTTPGGQANKNGGKKTDTAHDGVKHTVGTLGGKFCWDCHEPHGDRTSAGVGNVAMMRNNILAVTDGTYGYLGAAGVSLPVTYNLRTATPPAVGKTVETTTAAGTQHVGLCQACHGDTSEPNWTKYWNRLGYDDANGPPNTDRVASAHNSGSATAPYCVSCHPHAQKFKGTGACTDCHASAQPITVGPSAGGTRDPVVGEFANTWSHKRSAGGVVTKEDCVACHLEGDSVTHDPSALHQDGYIDLRDPDGLTPEAEITDMTGALFRFSKFSTSYAAGSRTSTGQTANTVDNVLTQKFCLACHDSNGATNAGVWVTGGTQFKPFNTTIAGAGYVTPLSAGVAGGVVDVKTQLLTTNSSKHPVLGPLTKDFPTQARLAAPYNNFTRAGTTGTLTTGVVINCFDCHNAPAAAGGPLTTRTVTAHGSANTLRGTPTVTGVPAAANAVTLCVVCHAGYNLGVANNHTAGSAFTINTNGGMTPYVNYGCNICHSSGFTTATVRPVRAQDVHGVNVLPTGGLAKTLRWAVAGAVPIAFIRNTQVLPNHSPKKVGATAYTPTCMGGNVAPCSQGSQSYTVGGTY